MNLESIPKTFWHSLSLSVVILSVGFVGVALLTGNLTIKYQGLELASRSDELGAALAEQQRNLEEKSARLDAQEKALAERLVEFEKAQASLAQLRDQLAKAPPAGASRELAEQIKATTTELSRPSLTPVVTPKVELQVVDDRILEQRKLILDRSEQLQKVQERLR